MRNMKIAAILGVLFPISLLAQSEITSGSWYNEEKTARVQFFMKDSKLNGKVVWMKDPEKKDEKNPDKKLRSQPILGSTFLTGFVSKDKKSWSEGKIYDPESGKTYSSKITVVSDKQLDVRGYIGSPLLGRTAKFIRVD